MTDEDRARYAAVDPANRFNVVVADIQRVVERNRRSGHMYEKAAHDVYRDCDLVLAAFKTCERIVTTPIPYQYTHMVNLVLFCFVFSAPLIFTVTFKWLTPFPVGDSRARISRHLGGWQDDDGSVRLELAEGRSHGGG